MGFRKKIETGKFVITGEIGPPKGVDIDILLKEAASLADKVDAVNVTDLQSSVMRLGSLTVCHVLKNNGIEPILQITCRDRNRLALQSDILSAHVLGINNVLVLTGDHPSMGDHPDSKPVFDLDAVTLLETIARLNKGTDLAGNELKGSPDMFAGAAVNPGADPLEPEIIKMGKKVKAGARFFQTQAVFDIDQYKNFLSKTKHIKVPILAGIVLLKSATMARFMNAKVAGVNVPHKLINEMENAADKKKKSVEIAVRLIKQLKPLSQGIHIMPIGWDSLITDIVDSLNISM